MRISSFCPCLTRVGACFPSPKKPTRPENRLHPAPAWASKAAGRVRRPVYLPGRDSTRLPVGEQFRHLYEGAARAFSPDAVLHLCFIDRWHTRSNQRTAKHSWPTWPRSRG